MKPLTAKMEEILMDCHERTLMRREPLSTYYTRHSKGLLIRGLIRAQATTINGKYFMSFVITDAGIQYLQNATASVTR